MSGDEQESRSDILVSAVHHCMTLPIRMEWCPKEDITTFELAQCLPYVFRGCIMPFEVDQTEDHFRHFKITDPN